MNQLLIIFALWSLAIGLGVYAALSALLGSQQQLKRRLQSVTDFTAPDRSPTHAVRKKSLLEVSTDGFERLLQVLASRLRPLWPTEYRSRLESKIVRAGGPGESDVDRLLVKKLFIGVGTAAFAFAISRTLHWSNGFSLLMVGGSLAGGFLLLDSKLDERIKARRFQIIRELPDVIDMLTISVTAGLAFEQAIAKMVRSSKGEVASEFDRVTREVTAGASRKEAMTAMSARVDVPEVSTFVATVLQAEAFGTPIAAVLKAQSAELRIRRRQRAEEEAAKAPVKMTIPVMLVLLPASILLLIGPALMSIAKMFG